MLHLLDTATRQGAAGARRCRSASIGGAALARRRPRTSAFTLRQRALARRRLLARRDDRQGRALDRERDRRPEHGRLRRARARPLEELRRPDDLRLPLPAAGALHRQAAGDHQHPRRARGPVAARLPRPQQLLPQRARRGASSSRTCAARPATARRSSQLDNGFEARGLGKDIGALLDWIATPARPRRRRASWSPAAATAAT